MSKLTNLKGMSIGGMKVLQQSKSEIQGAGDIRVMWQCLCTSCGTVQNITARYLQRRIRKDFVTRANLKCVNCDNKKVIE